jgi:hypothetical protein
MITGALSSGVKRQEYEADLSPPTSVESKNLDLYFHCSIRLHGLVLDQLSTGTALPFMGFVVNTRENNRQTTLQIQTSQPLHHRSNREPYTNKHIIGATTKTRNLRH